MSPTDCTIAHVGIAVPEIQAALAFYRDVLGASPVTLDPTDGAAIVSLPFGDVDIELLEPQSEESPIARFIAKRGPGIHHICYRVPDLAGALERCRRLGYRLVDQEPRTGAHGERIAFLHPKSTSGVLIELTEGGNSRSGG